ncbi:MAG: response regulator transcription factor [Thermodesulfovibrionales bacterium]
MLSSPNSRQHRIFLVDDHPLVRHALSQLINMEEDLMTCGEAGTIEAALAGLAQTEADVVIVDLSLDGGSGIRLIEEIQLRWPHMSILVVSMLDEATYAERCLRAGAKGYVMKKESPEQVILALWKVIRGDVAVSDRISTRLLSPVALKKKESETPMAILSNREVEVFQLLGQGIRPPQIAEKMCLSVKTVHTHIEHIKKKLCLPGLHELLVYASRWVTEEQLNLPPS